MFQKVTRRLDFVCAKRGFYRIQTADINGWDILMDQKYIRQFAPGAYLTVYPSPIPAPQVENLFTRINGTVLAKRFIHPDPFTFRGIREYMPQDPLKSINFKASAKAQQFMVNVCDYSITRQVVLMVNFEKHSAWHDEDLDERAIRIAAALAERLTRASIPVSFVIDGVKIPEGAGAGQLNNILEALAHIDLAVPPLLPFAEIVSETFYRCRTEPEYWLISTYHGADLLEAYEKLFSAGAKAAWILPTVPQMLVEKRVLEQVLVVEG
jgi:uncharacterized protein (DUF58 family)